MLALRFGTFLVGNTEEGFVDSIEFVHTCSFKKATNILNCALTKIVLLEMMVWGQISFILF